MVPASVALLVGFLLCGAMIRLGPMLGYVDKPDGFLKPHELPAVPLGGVGVFTAVHVAMAAAGKFDTGLLVASGIVLVLGLVDDRVGLSPKLRLAVETAAGISLGLWAATPALPGGVRSVVLSVILVVVAVNAVNLLDGLDGLVGGSTLVAAIGFAVLAVSRGLDGGFGLVLAGAAAGFLVWNWHPAKVFLGDNGAYSVAVFLVYGALISSNRSGELEIIVAAGILGVFVVDLAVTLLRRKLANRPLFEGDRSHVYDQLVDRGVGIPTVALTAMAGQAVLAAVVIGLDRWTAPLTTILILFVVLGAVVVTLDRYGFVRTDGREHPNNV